MFIKERQVKTRMDKHDLSMMQYTRIFALNSHITAKAKQIRQREAKCELVNTLVAFIMDFFSRLRTQDSTRNKMEFLTIINNGGK